jgi:gluconolactonase
VLYISDTSAALKKDGNHRIMAFDVVKGQDLAQPRVFADITPGLSDGFRLDIHEFLYTSCEEGVQVFHPDGTKLALIAVPEKVGNLTFGGAARDTLFICASSSLYSIRLNTQGLQCPRA